MSRLPSPSSRTKDGVNGLYMITTRLVSANRIGDRAPKVTAFFLLILFSAMFFSLSLTAFADTNSTDGPRDTNCFLGDTTCSASTTATTTEQGRPPVLFDININPLLLTSESVYGYSSLFIALFIVLLLLIFSVGQLYSSKIHFSNFKRRQNTPSGSPTSHASASPALTPPDLTLPNSTNNELPKKNS